MKDIERNELEQGAIYIVGYRKQSIIYARYSHETAASFIFKRAPYRCIHDALFTRNRIIKKFQGHGNIGVIKLPQALIDNYGIWY